MKSGDQPRPGCLLFVANIAGYFQPRTGVERLVRRAVGSDRLFARSLVLSPDAVIADRQRRRNCIGAHH